MLSDQCWWITGASSGIGEGLALDLAARGVRLILSGRNTPELERVAQACGTDKCLILPFDTRNFAAIPALVAQVADWAGRLDCLVNNAGISQRSLAVDTDFSVYQEIIAIDLLAPIALSQAVLPLMVAAGGGRLIAISSVAGIVGAPMRSAYSAAKHGIFGYFDSLRCETAHLGIKVHVIAPGSVKTNVSRNALLADGSRRGQSDDAIETGMSVAAASAAIVAAVEAETRELILAEGQEAHLAALRRRDPDALFDLLAASVARGYAAKMQAGERAL
jgi:dehydrogenase/reductase SDR family protein 7B